METTHQDLEHGAGARHWEQGHHHGLGLPSKERQGVWRETAGGTAEPWAAALLGGGEVTGKEDGAVRELGVEGRTSMTQHHKAGKPELHQRGERHKEYRPVKRCGIQSPAI